KRRCCGSTDTCKYRNRGCCSQSKQTASTTSRAPTYSSTSTCSSSRGSSLAYHWTCCSWRKADVKNAAGRRIGFTCRTTLFGCNFTFGLFLCSQNRAPKDDHSFHVAIIIVRQNKFGIRCDVQCSERTKIHGS